MIANQRALIGARGVYCASWAHGSRVLSAGGCRGVPFALQVNDVNLAAACERARPALMEGIAQYKVSAQLALSTALTDPSVISTAVAAIADWVSATLNVDVSR
ncbi:MAG: hypothetical protein SGPRY_006443, partial [Prymnesium sp.]